MLDMSDTPLANMRKTFKGLKSPDVSEERVPLNPFQNTHSDQMKFLLTVAFDVHF